MSDEPKVDPIVIDCAFCSYKLIIKPLEDDIHAVEKVLARHYMDEHKHEMLGIKEDA